MKGSAGAPERLGVTAAVRPNAGDWAKMGRSERCFARTFQKPKVTLIQLEMWTAGRSLPTLFRFEARGVRMDIVRVAMEDVEDSDWGHVELKVADTATAPLGVQVADFVLTSPPYCTRIDYTAATRVELALLSPLLNLDTPALSRQMIGSTRVPLTTVERRVEWGSTCNEFLDAVTEHPSKASAGYYLKTHLDYFDKLYRSLDNVAKALKPSSSAVLVVQDSFYKEIHNDLPKVVVEMAGGLGLTLTSSGRFSPRTSISHLNRFVRAAKRSTPPTEAVLYFSN